MENVKVERKGIGFTGLLTLIFITLKLCGVISWSWVWVLAPLWIGWALVLLIVGAVALGMWIFERWGW